MSKDDIWTKAVADAKAFSGLTMEAGSELSGMIRDLNEIDREVRKIEIGICTI